MSERAELNWNFSVYLLCILKQLCSFIHSSTACITSAYCVSMTVLDAKHNDEQSRRMHVLQKSNPETTVNLCFNYE